MEKALLGPEKGLNGLQHLPFPNSRKLGFLGEETLGWSVVVMEFIRSEINALDRQMEDTMTDALRKGSRTHAAEEGVLLKAFRGQERLHSRSQQIGSLIPRQKTGKG